MADLWCIRGLVQQVRGGLFSCGMCGMADEAFSKSESHHVTWRGHLPLSLNPLG